MKIRLVIASLLLAFTSTTAFSAPEKLSPADQAAGFKLKGKRWQAGDDPTPTYSPGAMKDVRDLIGDGLPEAIITEGGTGMLNILNTKGTGNWPDLEIGGPGFCFPVERWNGREYALHRHQYEGKACRRK